MAAAVLTYSGYLKLLGCVGVALFICLVGAECWIARHRREAQLAYLRGRSSSNTERAPAVLGIEDPEVGAGRVPQRHPTASCP